MAYVNHTLNLGLRYQKTPSLGLEVHSLNFQGFSNASYANNSMDRKSTSGYLFKFAGGAVCWKSRKQPVIATRSTEAEYIGYSIACKEAVWLKRLLQELQVHTSDVQTVVIYGDNKPTLALTLNPEHHAKTKHIDIQWHFVREQVRRGIVKLQYLSTTIMHADGLTKPLSGELFRCFLGLQMLPLLSSLNVVDWGEV